MPKYDLFDLEGAQASDSTVEVWEHTVTQTWPKCQEVQRLCQLPSSQTSLLALKENDIQSSCY